MALSLIMSGAAHVHRQLSAPSAGSAQALSSPSPRVSCLLHQHCGMTVPLAAFALVQAALRWHLNTGLIN